MLKAIMRSPASAKWAAASLQKDLAFVAAAVKANPDAFAFFDEKLRNRKAVVLAAVAADARALPHASERLQAHPGVRAAAKPR